MTYPRYNYAEDLNEDQFLRIRELEAENARLKRYLNEIRARVQAIIDQDEPPTPDESDPVWLVRQPPDADLAGVGACAACGAPQEVAADPLVARIERMRGAIADARRRVVQFMPDGPLRGSVIAFLDEAAYGRDHPAQCFNSFPGATMCEVCGGDLERKP